MEHKIVITRHKLKMTISIDGEKLNTKFMDYHPDGIVYKILRHFGIEADVEYIIMEEGKMFYNGKITDPCPYRHKYQLIDWATRRYPNETKKHWTDMQIGQLYALFYNTK